MKLDRGNLNLSTLWIITILILSFALISPEQAASRSHTSEITLFISGLGLQVGSTILNTSAQERYEEYLTATIQEDIQNKKDAAATHQNASVIMRRVGYGCIGLAVVISIFKQIDYIESNTVPSSEIQTMSRKEFFLTDYKFKPTGLSLNESPQFSLRPKYDFQTQRASLSLIHSF
ncbi:hypothetical protein C6497_05645 [Candidatus Poribacteria bacterium]|nr:MAG: hypothetical protein C6497_05645 [Candidatus Poribacteria bacterium]